MERTTKNLTCFCHVCKGYANGFNCQYCGCKTEPMLELLIPVAELKSVAALLTFIDKRSEFHMTPEQLHFLDRINAELSDYEFILNNILPKDDKEGE